RIGKDQSGGNGTILQSVSRWHGAQTHPTARAPERLLPRCLLKVIRNGSRPKPVNPTVFTFYPKTRSPPSLEASVSSLGDASTRSGGALLELRRQPQAALPARANWTNIFGYRLDLMSKPCLNPPYVVGVSCFCWR